MKEHDHLVMHVLVGRLGTLGLEWGIFDSMPHINSSSHFLKLALQIQAAGWGVLVELGPLLDKGWTADAAGVPRRWHRPWYSINGTFLGPGLRMQVCRICLLAERVLIRPLKQSQSMFKRMYRNHMRDPL